MYETVQRTLPSIFTPSLISRIPAACISLIVIGFPASRRWVSIRCCSRSRLMHARSWARGFPGRALFGMRNLIGVWPPSNPRGIPCPERDFWPLWPRPQVLPPVPIPLPTLFLYDGHHRSPGWPAISIAYRFVGSSGRLEVTQGYVGGVGEDALTEYVEHIAQHENLIALSLNSNAVPMYSAPDPRP